MIEKNCSTCAHKVGGEAHVLPIECNECYSFKAFPNWEPKDEKETYETYIDRTYIPQKGDWDYKETTDNKIKGEIKEMVNHPSHYNQGKYEPIDVIKDWKLNFDLGNVVKYIARCEYKGNKLQDLNKAMEYLQHEIKALEKADV